MNEGENQRTQAEASAEKMTPERTARAIFEYLPQRGWQSPGENEHDTKFVAALIQLCLREYEPTGNFRQDLESLISCQGQIPDARDILLSEYLTGCLANFDAEWQKHEARAQQQPEGPK